MKKNIYFTAALFAAMALATSCSDNQLTGDNEIAQRKTVTVSATTNDASSRVTYTDNSSTIKGAWDSTDALNIYQGTTWNTPNEFAFSKKADDHNATFSGTFAATPSDGDALNAIVKTTYPSVNVKSGDTAGTVFETLTDQTGTLEDAQAHNLLLGYTTYATNENPKFVFDYKLAVIKFKLTLPSTIGKDVNTQLFLTADGNTNPAIFLMNLNSSFSQKWIYNTGYSTPVVTTTATGGTEKDVYMCVYPSASTNLAVNVLVGGTKLYTVTLGDKTTEAGQIYSKTLNLASVTPTEYVLYQHFNKFIWGGNNANGRGGVKPASWSKDENTKEYFEYGTPVVSATGVTWGSDDFFGTMSDSYIASRDMTGWTGTVCNEHLGQMKLGNGSTASGSITTPEFTALTGTSNVAMSFDLIAWSQNTTVETPIAFSIEGGGTLDVTSVSLPVRVANSWTHVTLNITNATPTTKVTIAGTGTSATNWRFLLDNVEVVKK